MQTTDDMNTATEWKKGMFARVPDGQIGQLMMNPDWVQQEVKLQWVDDGVLTKRVSGFFKTSELTLVADVLADDWRIGEQAMIDDLESIEMDIKLESFYGTDNRQCGKYETRSFEFSFKRGILRKFGHTYQYGNEAHVQDLREPVTYTPNPYTAFDSRNAADMPLALKAADHVAHPEVWLSYTRKDVGHAELSNFLREQLAAGKLHVVGVYRKQACWVYGSEYMTCWNGKHLLHSADEVEDCG